MIIGPFISNPVTEADGVDGFEVYRVDAFKEKLKAVSVYEVECVARVEDR